MGSHTVCVRVTAEFLEFSRARGNDLSTPIPAYQFPGLKPGDQWCLCAARWQEAFVAALQLKPVQKQVVLNRLSPDMPEEPVAGGSVTPRTPRHVDLDVPGTSSKKGSSACVVL